MALGRAQVGDWLRSMNLEKYIQSFLDNGYDDMHVCRQIGHPDLDAIGVIKSDKKIILDQLKILLEQDSSATGPGPVYFTLENPEYDDPPLANSSSEESDGPPSLPPREYTIGPGPPTPRHTVDQENDHPEEKEVVVAMEMPPRVHIHGDGVVPSNSFHGSPSRHHSGDKSSEGFSDESAYLSGATSLEALNKEKLGELSDEAQPSRMTSTLGRLFRSRRHNPKYSYKQHQGDPSASEITMSENQRIQLMLQVKQGKLSQEDVLHKVKIYEEHKRCQTIQREVPPSVSFDGVLDHCQHMTKPQKQPRAAYIPTLFRTKLLPLFHKNRTKDAEKSSEHDRKGSLPVSCNPLDANHHDNQPRRGSLPAPALGTATETSSGEFDDWRASPERISTIHETEQPYLHRIYPSEDPESAAIFKDGRLLKQHPLRRCQEDTMDLNSDGMSQGESERTASSSLESVHSYSGGVPSLSSSSSQGSMTLDDPNSPRQPVCLARVMVDSVPSPYDKDALKLQKGDLIQVLKKNASGIWLGKLNNKIGSFKFINVELLSEEPASPGVADVSQTVTMRQGLWMPREGGSMVEALLNNLKLHDLVSVFMLNGYMTLDDLRELTEQDLDDLHVWRSEDRSKVMSAIQLINSGQAFPRDVAEVRVSTTHTNGATSSASSSPSLSRSDQSCRQRESKIPSPVSRMGHSPGNKRTSQKQKTSTHHRKADSGFQGHVNSVHDGEFDGVSSNRDWLNVSQTLGRHSFSSELAEESVVSSSNCDSMLSESYRYRTFSHSQHKMSRDAVSMTESAVQGSPSRIPRGRINSMDQNVAKASQLNPKSKKSPRSRQFDLAASIVDSAYSSAPNTPVLQRTKTGSRSSQHSPGRRSQEDSQEGDLSAMFPHLAAVKTAHIRSLTQTISRSAPCSPASVARITPAARSSVHPHPRAGKPPRIRSKGVEARLIEPLHFSQGDFMLPSAKSVPERAQDLVTMATVLKAVGLSQYEPVFKSHGITTRQHFLDLKEKDLRNLGIKSTDHLQKLLSWQQHLDLGEMRTHDPGSRAQSVSSLRDKV